MVKKVKQEKKLENLIEEAQDEKNITISEEDKDYKKQLEEKNTQLLRLQADFINFKKRSEKQKKDTINYAIEEFVGCLLPIVDNFKLAMESEINKENSFYDGVNLIYKQLVDVLKDNDVIEMNALGEHFNTDFHHAVFMEESDEYESEKVIEVLKAGYLLNKKVIRPAMVKVAK